MVTGNKQFSLSLSLSLCSSPHCQVGLSWFREKLSPAKREQRLSQWADFVKNCLPRIGSKELPQFREKYRALGRKKMGSNMRPRYIRFSDIRDRNISGVHCNTLLTTLGNPVSRYLPVISASYILYTAFYIGKPSKQVSAISLSQINIQCTADLSWETQ